MDNPSQREVNGKQRCSFGLPLLIRSHVLWKELLQQSVLNSCTLPGLFLLSHTNYLRQSTMGSVEKKPKKTFVQVDSVHKRRGLGRVHLPRFFLLKVLPEGPENHLKVICHVRKLKEGTFVNKFLELGAITYFTELQSLHS